MTDIRNVEVPMFRCRECGFLYAWSLPAKPCPLCSDAVIAAGRKRRAAEKDPSVKPREEATDGHD